MNCVICDAEEAGITSTCELCGEAGLCSVCVAPGQHYCRFAVVIPAKRKRGVIGRSIPSCEPNAAKPQRKASKTLDSFLRGVTGRG